MPISTRRPRRKMGAPLFVIPVMSTTSNKTPLRALKVCGVVSAADTEMIIRVARPLLPPNVELLIGAMMWPGSKRYVAITEASAIAAAANQNGAKSVAVFVDEDLTTIDATCKQAGFTYAQLHGPAPREALRAAGGYLPSKIPWIDVRDVASDGNVLQEDDPLSNPVWRIYDSKGGGTGRAFDWGGFKRPKEPWLLAGGLDPENICDAVTALHPDGVDVASGVAKEDRCRKDEAKLRLFVERLVSAYK